VQQVQLTSDRQSDQNDEKPNDPLQKIGSKSPVKSLSSDQKEWQGNVSQWESHNMPTRHTNPRTEKQVSQQGKLSELRWNGTREFIKICSNKNGKEM
jgi:hypothetical protein